MSSTRQLAAIMFTDIVGYTTLMGKDEPKAMELVRKNREVQKPLIEKYNGSLLKEMGDGNLASFPTASDAIYCAREIQQALYDNKELNLRIGIHLGEIRMEGGDIYGDGVNVASRLETIADPGGIYISDTVQKSIRSQPDIQTAYLGELELKNVDYPVKTYAIRGEFLPQPKKTDEKHLSGRLVAELRRRNVPRAGLAYLAVAFIIYSLLQFTTFNPTVLSITYGVLILGVPLSIYLAWNYERSPEGFVKVTSRKAWVNPYSDTQKKPFTGNTVIIVLLLLLVILVVYPRFENGVVSKNISTEDLITDKSIAVLPFVNLSKDPEQDYFSDGMMEEILNHLVQIKDLMVTSRTTSMRYKGSGKSIQEIGDELGVAYVLEGSVRKQGNKVRITVQLINGKTDKHLWSETFDRNMDDVFAIQSEVAQRVAASLQANIHPEVSQRFQTQPTTSTEAYSLFLQATFYLNNFIKIEEAQDLLAKALELDPEFARAHSVLGAYWMLRGIYFGDLDPSIAREKAMQSLKKAVQLNYQLADAHNYLSQVFLFFNWDFESTERERNIAVELNPDLDRQNVFGLIAMGRSAEAVVIYEKLVLRNPKDALTWGVLSLAYSFDNKQAESLEAAKQIGPLSISPNARQECRPLFYAHMYREVIENITSIYESNAEPIPYHAGYLACAYLLTNQQDKTNPIIEQLKKKAARSPVGSPSFYLAMIYAQMGEIDKAFEWLDRAYQAHEVELYWLKIEPPFEPLHEDPRWQEMLRKVGFPE